MQTKSDKQKKHKSRPPLPRHQTAGRVRRRTALRFAHRQRPSSTSNRIPGRARPSSDRHLPLTAEKFAMYLSSSPLAGNSRPSNQIPKTTSALTVATLSAMSCTASTPMQQAHRSNELTMMAHFSCSIPPKPTPNGGAGHRLSAL